MISLMSNESNEFMFGIISAENILSLLPNQDGKHKHSFYAFWEAV